MASFTFQLRSSRLSPPSTVRPCTGWSNAVSSTPRLRWWPMIWKLASSTPAHFFATFEDTQATTDSASVVFQARPPHLLGLVRLLPSPGINHGHIVCHSGATFTLDQGLSM